MCGRIVPVDLLAEIWRLDWRLSLRLLQCGREEGDEHEEMGKVTAVNPWSSIYNRGENPRGVAVKNEEIRIFDQKSTTNIMR